MKKYFVLLILMFFQFGISQKITEKSLLWEISGKELKQPSYLYGTIHIACQGEVEMTDELQQVFDKSERLVLEMDLSDPTLPMKMLQLSLSSDGKKISEKLNPETAQKLDDLLQSKLSISLSALDNLNPQAILMQLSLLGLECPMDMGYDMMFLTNATAENKEILGLESMEEQIAVLFALSEEDAIQAITYLADHIEELQNQTRELFQHYKNKDIQAMYEITKTSFEDPNYPQTDIKVLLDDRNINWIPEIERIVSEKPSFIAVGAAHLAGDNGVINLLKKEGYTLKPLHKD